MGRGFSAGGLRHWAYRLKELGVAPIARRPAKAKRAATTRKKNAFPARLRIVRLEPVAAVAPPVGLTVEIGAARVRVPEGTHEATLQVTIGALARAVLGDGH